jgi:hypothetical protein
MVRKERTLRKRKGNVKPYSQLVKENEILREGLETIADILEELGIIETGDTEEVDEIDEPEEPEEEPISVEEQITTTPQPRELPST